MAQTTGAAMIAEYQWLCANAPVEIEGTLTDGRKFYFRARWNLIELRIGDDPIMQPSIATRTTKGEFEASWLSESEALRILNEMVAET